jgi:antitoxin HigA-1
MSRSKTLRNVHPGEVLVEEFLKPLGLSQYLVAKRLRVPLTRIAEICRGRRSVTADTALRLSRFFGTTSKFWLGLQEDYDLEEELRASRGVTLTRTGTAEGSQAPQGEGAQARQRSLPQSQSAACTAPMGSAS